MRPVLAAVGDGAPLALSALRERITVTEEERHERLPSRRQTVINNRVGWARTYLNKAGLLSIPDNGQVQITQRGQEVLATGPELTIVGWLKRYPEFAEFHTARPSSIDSKELPATPSEEITPDKQLNQAHQVLMQSLADELLTQVRAATPTFFAQLVVDFMIAMGYGGSHKEAGRATKQTNDDGIIKEDKLGLDVTTCRPNAGPTRTPPGDRQTHRRPHPPTRSQGCIHHHLGLFSRCPRGRLGPGYQGGADRRRGASWLR